MEVNDIPAIKSRKGFLEFIAQFKNELLIYKDDIENCSIMSYMEAMGAWLNDYEGLHYNLNILLPQNIPWKVIGFILMGAIVTGDTGNRFTMIKEKVELCNLLATFSSDYSDELGKGGLSDILSYLESIKMRVEEGLFFETVDCGEEDIPWAFIAQIIDAAAYYE